MGLGGRIRLKNRASPSLLSKPQPIPSFPNPFPESRRRGGSSGSFSPEGRERFSEPKTDSASPDSEGRLLMVMPDNQNPDGIAHDAEKKMIRETL
jgi:hypothetical protein